MKKSDRNPCSKSIARIWNHCGFYMKVEKQSQDLMFVYMKKRKEKMVKDRREQHQSSQATYAYIASAAPSLTESSDKASIAYIV